jgi:inosine-uridine nucleoside N-ribohydrolase
MIYLPTTDSASLKLTVAEWNVWVDPVAAREVFSSGLDLYLLPLDETNKITWTMKDIKNGKQLTIRKQSWRENLQK